jgi:hypothetical protein
MMLSSGGLVKERVRTLENEPKLIKTWAELKECKSETHELKIDVRGCNGWVRLKNSKEFKDRHYLSTHTFYGNCHEDSTKLLQKCGFNVRLENWDE